MTVDKNNICLRKSEVSIERISGFTVNEKLAEHGRYILPCSGSHAPYICFYRNLELIFKSK